MSDSENPYRSPASDGLEPSASRLDKSAEWHARLTRRAWVYRRLQIAGRTDAVVEYNGRGFGYESVLVNGKTAARKWNWEIWTGSLMPRIDFELCCGQQRIPAFVEVRGILFLRAFRLYVDGTLVYTEGSW